MVNKIRESLRAYGIRKGSKVICKKYGYFSLEIYINGELFGIWDITSNNFVA